VSYLILYLTYLTSLSEFNQRVFVKDGPYWSVRGLYNDAVNDNEGVEWVSSQGEQVLGILVVRLA
jgi:hypothetical protein